MNQEIGPFRVAIISQDQELRQLLAEWLPQLWQDVCVCGEAETGQDGLELVQVCQPQVVFCDMPLPDLCGMEIGLGLEGHCHPVFLLERTQAPMDQLEKVAVDFLLKPVSREQVKRKLDDLRSRLAVSHPDSSLPVASRIDELRVMDGARIRMLPMAEVLAVEANGTRCRVYTAEGESLTNWSFRELMAELDPESFRPISRTVLVRLAQMERMVRQDAGGFILTIKGVERSFNVSPAFSGPLRRP